jgi:HEAT repeat protein
LARIVRYDAVAEVRAAAVEALGSGGLSAYADVAPAVDDPDLRVVEAATTALGEIGATEATPWLERAACAHPDRLVREAAVAALGAIGDPDSVPVILDVLRTGPPQVRRRAVVALSVFDHPAVEPALREAARDRNPMVRDVASMLVSPPA